MEDTMQRFWMTMIMCCLLVTACGPRLEPGVDLSGRNLSQRDMAGANLAGANLSGANLDGANLTSANLQGANLSNTDLSKTTLSNALLSAADLRGTVLSGQDLSGMDLTGANLQGAKLNGANLTSANLQGAKLDGANLTSANLQGANLSNTDLSKTTLSNALLSAADLRGTVLSGQDLSGMDLTWAKLQGAKLDGANLTSANLQLAGLSNIDLSKTTLSNALLSGANLRGTVLSGQDLSGMDLTWANLQGAKLDGVNFTNAILDGANMIDAIGLTDEMLDDAASLTQVRLQTLGQIQAALSGVCQGQRVPQAAAYTGGAGPIILLGNEGQVIDWSSMLPTTWTPTGIRFTELVACVGEEVEQRIQTCYYDGPNIERFRYSRFVRLVQPKTGITIASRTISGADPRHCMPREPWALTRLEGKRVSLDLILDWLKKYVSLPSSPSMPSPETQLVTGLLLQPGDFPPDLNAGEVIDPPGMFRDVPLPDRAYFQRYTIGGNPAGGVAVFEYEDVSKVREAYSVILSGMGDTEPLSNVGEQARIAVYGDPGGAELIFIRCSAVIHIRVVGPPNIVDAVRSYAKRLDTRLTGVVCQ